MNAHVLAVRDDTDPDEDLAELLDQGRDGPRGSRANIALILQDDPRWGNVTRNQFTQELLLADEAVTDEDVTAITIWLDRTYRVNAEPKAVLDCLLMHGAIHGFHPVRDYFNGLTWDGTPRLSRWLRAYLGAPESDLSDTLGRKFMISVVARVMQPGCKVDTTLVLQGKQGIGKSTAAQVLAGTWFKDTPLDIGNKDSYMAIQGVLIYEIAELQSFRGRDATAIKAFISSPKDDFRPPYGRMMVHAPRQCVFIATTNDDDFLVDPTGHRRYWVVPVTGCDRARLAADRDQLWAEAIEAYMAGEIWHLDDIESAQLAATNSLFEPDDAWSDQVIQFMRGRGRASLLDVATGALDMRTQDVDRGTEMRLANILKRGGYEKDKRTRPVRWALPNRSA